MPSEREDFIVAQGLPFLAHMLRRMSDVLVQGAGDWEADLGIEAPPRTASTILLLSLEGPLSVTAIASRIRQSHPLVITWLRQLEEHGIVKTSASSTDRRRKLVALTPKGRVEAKRMAEASRIIGRTYRSLLKEIGCDLFKALVQLQEACERAPLKRRLEAEASKHLRMPSGPGAQKSLRASL